jgi:chromate transporter
MILELFELALAFAKIGLLTIGGGMVMLPLIRSEMLAHGWLTEMQFIEILGVSEATPGPLAANCATFVGWRVAGLPGAIVATLSLAAPAFLCVMLFGMLWRKYQHHPGQARVMSLLRPIITGLILAVALRLCHVVLASETGAAGWLPAWRPSLVAALVCAAVAHGRLSPVLALLIGAGIGAGLYAI